MRRTRVQRICTVSCRILQERMVIHLDHRRGNRHLGTRGRLGPEPTNPPGISDPDRVIPIQRVSEPNKKNQNQFQRKMESPRPTRTLHNLRTTVRRVGFAPTTLSFFLIYKNLRACTKLFLVCHSYGYTSHNDTFFLLFY